MQKESTQLTISRYLTEIRKSANSFSNEQIAHISNQAVSLFFEYFQSHNMILREAIQLLCEISTHPDPKIATLGTQTLFPHLIERLNDAFDPSYCEVYDRLFSQVISFCRAIPEGKDLHFALNSFGLTNENAILDRRKSISDSTSQIDLNQPIKKILVLSRITIGADVSITSVILSHLKQLFPQAELVILGPAKLAELFSNEPRIRVKPIHYGRTDTLLSRLRNWLAVLAAIQDEVSTLSANEFYIFDPDSRLTQLGLLPLVQPQNENSNYFYFESRKFSSPGIEKLGQLTSQWMTEITGTDLQQFPFISLSPQVSSMGSDLADWFRSPAKQRIVFLSFGFGGNSIKRVSEYFETAISHRLSESNKLFIDSGATNTETTQVETILTSLATAGKSILRLNENNIFTNLSSALAPIDVIAWQGSIGYFASLLAASDFYLGYDSAGQHLAAALGVPSLTVFVNSGNERFSKRWQPWGQGKPETFLLDPCHDFSQSQIIADVLGKVVGALG